MSQRISETTLSMLSSFVADQMGLLFPRERWSDLEKGMASAAPHFGFSNTLECIRWLMSAPLTRPQVETLAGFLTVGESYFFRDPRIFKIAESEILPELTNARRGRDQRLRIWSAGCSSGEEAYSIAILLHRIIPDIKQWNVSILATDINPAALHRGIAAVYGKWSFRGTPSWFKTLYFTQVEEGRFRVAEQIRRMVSFEYLNLAADSYPSLFSKTNAMDLIFCRNVLMYFSRDMVRTVTDKLHRSLVDNGWLIVGPVESWQGSYQSFEAVTFDVTTCYRKRGGEPQPQQGPVSGQAGREPGTTKLEVTAGEPEENSAMKFAHPLRSADQVAPAVHSPYDAAVEYYRQGLYPQAVAILSELSAREPIPAEAWHMLVKSHANLGELAKALQLCEEAVNKNKLDPALHHLRADILQEQGLIEEARASLERAIYLDPKLVLAHFALGNLTLWSGKPDKARKHFENAALLLDGFAPGATLPNSEGMTAGRLREIIRQITP